MEADGVEFTGKTVEDAISAAESGLSVSRVDLLIDVITQGRSGVFGIGAESARVVARRRPQVAPPVELEQRPDVEDLIVQEGPDLREDSYADQEDNTSLGEFSEDKDQAESSENSARRRSTVDLPVEARDVLQALLDRMGFHSEVEVRSTEDPVILEIHGENLGVLIGRRGDNLSALQFMVNLILSKGRRQWPRVVVDVENYRARREDSLSTLADRMAFRVTRSGRPFTLEAMPATDRRIIHLALRDRTDVETYSIGEGPSRRVVIAPRRDGGTSDPEDGEDID